MTNSKPSKSKFPVCCVGWYDCEWYSWCLIGCSTHKSCKIPKEKKSSSRPRWYQSDGMWALCLSCGLRTCFLSVLSRHPKKDQQQALHPHSHWEQWEKGCPKQKCRPCHEFVHDLTRKGVASSNAVHPLLYQPLLALKTRLFKLCPLRQKGRLLRGEMVWFWLRRVFWGLYGALYIGFELSVFAVLVMLSSLDLL